MTSPTLLRAVQRLATFHPATWGIGRALDGRRSSFSRIHHHQQKVNRCCCLLSSYYSPLINIYQPLFIIMNHYQPLTPRDTTTSCSRVKARALQRNPVLPSFHHATGLATKHETGAPGRTRAPHFRTANICLFYSSDFIQTIIHHMLLSLQQTFWRVLQITSAKKDQKRLQNMTMELNMKQITRNMHVGIVGGS